MPGSILSSAEQTLLSGLLARGVRFMIVGMSGALLQGARGVTEDIDLWFEDLSDPRIAEAVHDAGGVWISGAFGMGPPRIGGDALSERFDVVTSMTGLGPFAEELRGVRYEEVDGIALPVLPLERIAASKRAADRDKDRAALPSLLDALAVIDAKKPP
jgi:hypothetical protein